MLISQHSRGWEVEYKDAGRSGVWWEPTLLAKRLHLMTSPDFFTRYIHIEKYLMSLSLLIRMLISSWSPCLHTKLTLFTSQRPHLQTPSRWILGLCRMNLEETQTFGLYFANTVGIYLSHMHVPFHWGFGDSGSTNWASLPDKGWNWSCAIHLSSSLNQLWAKTCSSQEVSQELSFTSPWITHVKNH